MARRTVVPALLGGSRWLPMRRVTGKELGLPPIAVKPSKMAARLGLFRFWF